ncbi:hypothetical protein BJY04DRAFT_184952 [Aspergillus karnatakaensis]|uniref:uncharacterized protein n=1 Tax=Aspergillus karnatakaensis TaxID=1810916 RepID=UPI003CCD38ED
MALFRTFLIAKSCDKDLNGVLYLLKVIIGPWNKSERWSDSEHEHENEHATTPLTPSSEDSNQVGEREYNLDRNFDFPDLTECANCKVWIRTINHWHFCRSCPFSAFCRFCYREVESRPDTFLQYPPGCSSQHRFYHTCCALRRSEYVPSGMVPLSLARPDDIGSDDVEIVSVEKWKERLAEKWDTNRDVMFEGGLNAWCLCVLKGETRERWAAAFR